MVKNQWPLQRQAAENHHRTGLNSETARTFEQQSALMRKRLGGLGGLPSPLREPVHLCKGTDGSLVWLGIYSAFYV